MLFKAMDEIIQRAGIWGRNEVSGQTLQEHQQLDLDREMGVCKEGCEREAREWGEARRVPGPENAGERPYEEEWPLCRWDRGTQRRVLRS